MQTFVQVSLVFAALMVALVGFFVLRSYPAGRHHVVPFGLLLLVLLAWLFPLEENVRYEAAVEAIQFERSGELALDGELNLRAVYLACDGLVVRIREGRIESAERKQQAFRTLTVSVVGGGQIEILSISPSYVAAEIRYGKTGSKEWRVEALSGRDGVSLRLSPDDGSVRIKAARATIGSRGARATLDGRDVKSESDGRMTFAVEMLGHYPIEIDGSSCKKKEGYLEFVLLEGKVNQFTVAGAATGLSGLELQGIRKGTKKKDGEESPLTRSNAATEGAVEHLGPIVIKGGLLEIAATAREPGSLVGKVNENPLWMAVLAIVGLWMNQLVIHGLIIEKKEDDS